MGNYIRKIFIGFYPIKMDIEPNFRWEEFQELVKNGISPIDALYKIFPNNEIIGKYRENTPEKGDRNFLSELQRLGFDKNFIYKYFFYSSGLSRSELPFIPRPIPETIYVPSPYQFSREITVDRIGKIYYDKPTLFGIVTYGEFDPDVIPEYYYQPESDYFLFASNFTYVKNMKEAKDFLNRASPNIELIIVKEGKIGKSLHHANYFPIILDLRSATYKYIYHRTFIDINPQNINTLILERLSDRYESIYQILTDIGQKINPLLFAQTSLYPHILDYINIMAKISQLIKHPDATPETVESLYQFVISRQIIDNYLIYPSGRPRTSLPFIPSIRTLDSIKNFRVISGDANPDRCWLLSPELMSKDAILQEDVLIPVVRYEKGMGRGIYTTVLGSGYCGTFYYFEPASDYYLFSSRVLISVNKLTAYYYLMSEIGKWEIAKDEILETLRRHQMYLPNLGNSAEDIFSTMLNRDPKLGKFNKNLYAVDDEYDQRLCQVAKSEGIQVIILAIMTGANRLVTEVLDTRDRSISFSSIYKKPEIIVTKSEETNSD